MNQKPKAIFADQILDLFSNISNTNIYSSSQKWQIRLDKGYKRVNLNPKSMGGIGVRLMCWFTMKIIEKKGLLNWLATQLSRNRSQVMSLFPCVWALWVLAPLAWVSKKKKKKPWIVFRGIHSDFIISEPHHGFTRAK